MDWDPWRLLPSLAAEVRMKESFAVALRPGPGQWEAMGRDQELCGT